MVAENLDEVDAGTLVIRSHGVDPAIISDAQSRGLDVVDATCPHVSKAHEAAEELMRGGYLVIIVGEADHPEVEGIMAHAGGKAVVVSSALELPERLASRRVGIVVQTTQSLRRLTEVVEAVLPRVSELRVFNTICSATGKRQQSAEELAGTVDVMVVVGGHNSGNTTRLAEICREVNPRVHHVETPDDLDPDVVRGRRERGRHGRCVDARRADARRHRRHRSDGVRPVPSSAEYGRRIPAVSGGGVIASVEPASPAARAGLAVGDTVVTVDGSPLRDIIDWQWLTDGAVGRARAAARGRRGLLGDARRARRGSRGD